MSAPERLSAGEARRIALAAQGFVDPRPRAGAGRAHLRRVFDRVGLIQIDSVNVIARSHYLPPFARLGPYDRTLLEAAAWGPRRWLFEYWGHEASLIPVELQPLFRWRMARAREGQLWAGLRTFGRERGPFIESVLREIEARGPIGAGELERAGKGAGGWWGWSDGKRALEWLFWAGLVTTATRRGFERLYDLPERVLPRVVVAAPTPEPAEARRELVRIAARALGVATASDLKDYFRLQPADARAAIADLESAGELAPVEVKGWDRPAWLWPSSRRPRRIEASALLSPFDSLVWRRERTERLFGFRYRLEIYTPAHKREHGYYVLPYLHRGRLSARLDLKSDRSAGRLLVRSAHLEPGEVAGEIAPALIADLNAMSSWLGLGEVHIEARSELGHALADARRTEA